GIGLMCRSIAANNFYDIWNPSAGLFPLLALIFVAWSIACGDYRLLPLGALLVSFLLQLEDSFVPAALGLSVVGLLGLGLWRARTRRARVAVTDKVLKSERDRDVDAVDRTGLPRVWPWALAGAA